MVRLITLDGVLGLIRGSVMGISLYYCVRGDFPDDRSTHHPRLGIPSNVVADLEGFH